MKESKLQSYASGIVCAFVVRENAETNIKPVCREHCGGSASVRGHTAKISEGSFWKHFGNI
ncbi:hypothetical protein MAR_019262 [Mya arenaria]|uniref:Uncharacterized protein n=1 Tax=Mya arenaria TaxID=6604 RepID=A0ABY7ELP8_MYAAR|nr:hypothetical protein MAR_019262 [Mya arenaria]